MKFGLVVCDLRIEKDLTKESFSIVITFVKDATDTFSHDIFAKVAFLDNFKLMQSKQICLKEFLLQFSPTKNSMYMPIYLHYRQGSDVHGLNLLVFGENKELIEEPCNLDAVSDWAFFDRYAAIIVRPRDESPNELNRIFDQTGALLPSPKHTLSISIALSRPMNLRKENMKVVMRSMCKVIKSVEFSNFSLLSHVQGIRISRISSTPPNTNFNDDVNEMIPFDIEWVCNIHVSEHLKDEESVLSLINELAKAFFLLNASIGFVNDFLDQKAEIKRIIKTGPFPQMLQSSLHQIVTSKISFPRFSLITDFENTARLHLPVIQKEKQITNIVNQNSIVKTPEKSIKDHESGYWDCFIRVSQDPNDSYFYLTSLTALQHLIPAFKLSSAKKVNRDVSSQNFVKALLTLAKQDKIKGVIFSDIRSYCNATSEAGDGNLIEMSLQSLNSSTKRTNHKIISSVIDETSKFSNRGVVGLQLLFSKTGLTSCLLLLRKENLRDSELL